MSTRDTTARVRGVSRCAKNQHRTCTRVTHFGNTAGLPVPVLNPTHSSEHISLQRLHNCLHIRPVRWNIATIAFSKYRSNIPGSLNRMVGAGGGVECGSNFGPLFFPSFGPVMS